MPSTQDNKKNPNAGQDTAGPSAENSERREAMAEKIEAKQKQTLAQQRREIIQRIEALEMQRNRIEQDEVEPLKRDLRRLENGLKEAQQNIELLKRRRERLSDPLVEVDLFSNEFVVSGELMPAFFKPYTRYLESRQQAEALIERFPTFQGNAERRITELQQKLQKAEERVRAIDQQLGKIENEYDLAEAEETDETAESDES